MMLSMGTEQDSNHEGQGKKRKGESQRMGKGERSSEQQNAKAKYNQ
jgi:hypothetical protein